MAITYTWAVTGMKATTVGTEANYVIQTYWTKTGTDENGNTGVFSGATPLTPNPEQTNVVPHSQLTQEIVLSWIRPIVTGSYEEHVNGVIAKQIAEKIAPVTEPALPWASPEPTPAP
jgi:sugar (pentulose or hexulose) kinase